MTTESSILVACACGKRLKAPATAVGKKARCPACGAALLVAAPNISPAAVASPTARSSPPPRQAAAPVAAPPAEAQPEDDGLDALYDLADQARSAPAVAEAPRCPQCQSAMQDGAVVCTNCEYDSRAGKPLAAAAPRAPMSRAASAAAVVPKSKQPIDRMAPQGHYLAGVVVCAVFALAASLVWIAVAWLTGIAIGYIALLIGVAAGAGMRIGHKGFSVAGGYTAAAMTLAAILIAKVVVLVLLVHRNHPDVTISNIDFSKYGFYFFSPIGVIIMLVGIGAAFRTANGGMKG